MEDRQKRLLGLIEQAMGKTAYSGNVSGSKGEDTELTEDASEAALLLPTG